MNPLSKPKRDEPLFILQSCRGFNRKQPCQNVIGAFRQKAVKTPDWL
jgi:hypothetical protein